jgi:hypothetical protein
MKFHDPEIDEMVFNWIKKGFNSYGEILKLKSDYRIKTYKIIKSLERLEEYDLIKKRKDKYIINNIFEI